MLEFQKFVRGGSLSCTSPADTLDPIKQRAQSAWVLWLRTALASALVQTTAASNKLSENEISQH
jgi:hypothetical protein